MISTKMFSTLRAALVTGCLGLASMTAFAGNPPLGTVRATVPFSFEMDGKVMPAGQYVFRPMDTSNVMQVQTPDGKSVNVMMVPGSNSDTTRQPRVVFGRSDVGYVLKEVWVNGVAGGGTIPVKSAAAKTAGSAASVE